jgi:hypothetical protein
MGVVEEANKLKEENKQSKQCRQVEGSTAHE